MIKIEYPAYAYKIEKNADRELIFDTVRRQWVYLTPEEWVRQNFLQYLLIKKNYPASLIAVEKEIYLGNLKKRCDIIAYNRDTQPLMIVECKSMDIELGSKTIEQVLRYNISVPVRYLVITNGVNCCAYERLEGNFNTLQDVPGWND